VHRRGEPGGSGRGRRVLLTDVERDRRGARELPGETVEPLPASEAAGQLRVSVQARNLFVKTDYWSFDPEFNNFGNQNFNRFIDLGPFPSSRQFFFSVDLGF